MNIITDTCPIPALWPAAEHPSWCDLSWCELLLDRGDGLLPPVRVHTSAPLDRRRNGHRVHLIQSQRLDDAGRVERTYRPMIKLYGFQDGDTLDGEAASALGWALLVQGTVLLDHSAAQTLRGAR